MRPRDARRQMQKLAPEARTAVGAQRNQELRAQVALLRSRKSLLEIRIRRAETQLKLWKWELVRRKFHDFESAVTAPEAASLAPDARARLAEMARLLDLEQPWRAHGARDGSAGLAPGFTGERVR